MIKKALHTIALISCFLGISSITGCTDGIFSPRGYIPEETSDEDQKTSPLEAQPPQSQKTTPAFIQRILNENDVVLPEAPPPPPKPAPKKPEPDLLDAS